VARKLQVLADVRTLVVLAAFFLVLCGDEEDARSLSGGRIVLESRVDLHPVDASRLTLGGPGGKSLFGVRNAVVLGDQIVVAEAARLFWYSLGGELLFEVGSKGDGPGEFRKISSFHFAEGLVRVYDRTLRRITEFGEDGELVSVRRLLVPSPFVGVDIVGYLSDGRAVALLFRSRSRPTHGQVVRDPAVVAILDAAGASMVPLASILYDELYIEPYGRSGQLQMTLPFGKGTGVAVLGASVAISDGNSWAIMVVNAETGKESFLVPPGNYAPTELLPSQLAYVQGRSYVELLNRRVSNEQPFRGLLFEPPYGWSGCTDTVIP